MNPPTSNAVACALILAFSISATREELEQMMLSEGRVLAVAID